MSSGVVVGAIRWDAWYINLSSSATAIAQLGPSQFQYRAPWFFNTYPNANLIDTSGDRQLVMDLEIGYAAAAGLKFWAFDQFLPTSTLHIAWQFYQQSALNSLINFCWIASPSGFAQFTTAQYVAWFGQSNYQKVLSNRPLFFLLIGASDNLTTLASGITALRAAASGAGIGNPYIVAMRGDAATGYSTMQAVGADAIGSYNGTIPNGTPSTYAAMDASVQAFWAQMMATTAPVVPICQMGWDVQPLTYPTPPAGWVTPGTVAERAAHLQAGINFVKANPAACPANVLLTYSWTECSEGGGSLIPTIGDPPAGPPPALNQMLSAAAAVF